jgi:hypothetical protein
MWSKNYVIYSVKFPVLCRRYVAQEHKFSSVLEKKSVKEYISAIYDYNQLKSSMRASSLAECVCFHGNTPREEGLFERPRLCILCLNVSLNAYR